MNRLIYIVIITSIIGCTRKEDKAFVVTKIRSAAKLATQEVILNKIVIGDNVDGKKRLFGLFGDEKLNTVIFNTEATVKYGIRLDKIRNKDVFLKEDSVHIILPPIEIISFSYPHEKFVELFPLSNFDRITASSSTIDDLDKVFRLAEIEIRQKLELLNLREEAKLKTVVFLEKFLAKAGYHSIVIEFNEDKDNG